MHSKHGISGNKFFKLITICLSVLLLQACAQTEFRPVRSEVVAQEMVWTDVHSDMLEVITGDLECSKTSLMIVFCRKDEMLSPVRSDALLSDSCRGQPLTDIEIVKDQAERKDLARWIDSIFSEKDFYFLRTLQMPLTKQDFNDFHDADQRLRLLNITEYSTDTKNAYTVKWIAICAYNRFVTASIKPRLTKEYIGYLDNDEEFATYVWILVQHSDFDPQWQEFVAQRFGRSSKIFMRRNAAFLTDRVLVAKGLSQRYGTQLRCLQGQRVPFPLENPETVDDRRRWAGMGTLKQRIADFPRPCPKQ